MPRRKTKLQRENPGGRPPAFRDVPQALRTIEGLGSINCTKAEAAAVMGVAESTFYKFLDEHPEADEAWHRGKNAFKPSIRRAQFELMKKSGPVAMKMGELYLEDQKPAPAPGSLQNPLQVTGAIAHVHAHAAIPDLSGLDPAERVRRLSDLYRATLAAGAGDSK